MLRCKEYEKPYEAPYVVYLNNHCRIDEEKFLFEFIHPNWNCKAQQERKKIPIQFLIRSYFIFQKVPTDNNRYAKLEFKAKFDATLHGFSGYFDSHLYKEIDISILFLF